MAAWCILRQATEVLSVIMSHDRSGRILGLAARTGELNSLLLYQLQHLLTRDVSPEPCLFQDQVLMCEVLQRVGLMKTK